ncbi:hypothetical protein AAL_07716 [Moelleriella libera RCEF 2490]|uniref:Uncharacterized protein n=1 Tax=Moelleriella libera RCEF 2490 TaxID=1081109 RepID=A0A167WYA0_9HYPO|nr:hypothetical protein AAL_07716 [Moelleriella libera RCEF 2490]
MARALLVSGLLFAAAQAQDPSSSNSLGLDLGKYISQQPLVQNDLQEVKKLIGKARPYSEGSLERFDKALPDVPKNLRKCYRVRNTMEEKNFRDSYEIVANPDSRAYSSNDQGMKLSISKSVAKIATQRLGWSVEESSESGRSVTAGTSAGGSIGVADVSFNLDATIYDNQRYTSGLNGDSTDTFEERTDTATEWTCPANSRCQFVTWTYVRKISGECHFMVAADDACLAQNPLKEPYQPPPAPKEKGTWEKIGDWVMKNAPRGKTTILGRRAVPTGTWKDTDIRGNCSFAYVLRYKSNTQEDKPDGKPYIAQSLISTKAAKPEKETTGESKGTNVPKAVQWVGEGDKAACKLAQDGWFWQPGQWFFRSKQAGGKGRWVQLSHWPKPEGHGEKCSTAAGSLPKGAEFDENDSAPLEARAEQGVAKMEMIINEMPKFIEELKKTGGTGFVGNDKL